MSILNMKSETVLSSQKKELLGLLDRVAGEIQSLGYPVQAVSPSSLRDLALQSEAKVSAMIQSYQGVADLIAELPSSEIGPDQERSLFLRALRRNGFKCHPDFLDRETSDVMIEVYSSNMTQIYRSFNFFKISGYSLLDLGVYEWFVLWERPRVTMERIMGLAHQVLQEFIPAQKYDVQPHLVREIHNSGMTEPFEARLIMADMQVIGSICELGDPFTKSQGAVATSKGQILSKGREAEFQRFL